MLAGPDERSARAWRLELPGPRHETLGGYRIAVVFDDPYCPVDTTVVEVLTSLVATLRSAGATIEETSPPAPLSETDPLYQQTLAGVTAAFQPPQAMDFFEGMVTHADTADTNPLTQWARWNLQTVREWSFAREARAQLKARWAEFFNQYNALLCPVSNVPAISHADSPQAALRTILVNGRPTPYLSQSIWSGLATVADLPAVAVPAGLTTANLPVGVQVVAPYLEDRTAIDIGRHIERVAGRLTPN